MIGSTRGSPLRYERAFKAIGKPLARKEDARLITGKGRFTDDFTLPGQVWAAMVRSPYPHARILGIDPSAALEMPGVLGVYTGADCVADGPEGHPPQSGPLNAVRCQVERARQHAGLHRLAYAAAGG